MLHKLFGGGSNEENETPQTKFERIGRIAQLEKENEELREQLKREKRGRDFIDIDVGDPDKRDIKDRKAYVSKVAEVHDKVLIPKLKLMSSVVRESLTNENLPEHKIRMFQGADYAIHELIRWGNMMKSEHMSYQEGDN